MARTGRRPVLPDAEILIAMWSAGKSHPEIADMYGVTKQAVQGAIRRATGGTASGALLPWTLPRAHRRKNKFERDATAWVKRQRGMECTPDEVRWAKDLERTATALRSVLIYDPNRGFMWRDRRPSDTDIIAKT